LTGLAGHGDSSRYYRLRTEVAAAVDELFTHELITPTGGNVSVRCPDSDHILITASRVHKGGLGPEHILEVDTSGRPVLPDEDASGTGPPLAGFAPVSAGSGRRIRPSVETGMHLAIYDTRPDVGAVVHAHAPLATVWGLFDEPVLPLTIDSVRFTDLRVVPFAAPGSSELATATAEALGRGWAALLRNHGLVAVGRDLREAVNVTLALEETLRVAFLSRVAVLCGLGGKEPVPIPPRAADFLRKILIG
jgi:ribulose-5-phosphate 4-epimerase/fuculose-1-phosphate aldolase